MQRILIVLCASALVVSCKSNTRDDEPVNAVSEAATATQTAGPSAESPPETMPESAPESGVSTVSGEAISARVAASKARLQSSDAGQKLWASIEAAGGLEPWFGSGALHFRFKYMRVGKGATDTIQTINTWSSLARHQLADNKDVEFGWNGKVAWVNPADADPGTNPRFWSLTPYYFVGIPWVLADPGVNLESLPDAEFEGKQYDLVKATFEAGTGDAPDDYYILYLDKETHRVRALRYVVSYKGFRPEGGHGPEKLMAYDGDIKASGLTFAASHRTFQYDEETGKLGEKVTDVEVSDVAFKRDVAADYYEPPDGAKIIEGWK